MVTFIAVVSARSLIAVSAALLLARPGVAGPLSLPKAQAKRSEARELVTRIASGEGNVNAAVNRLTFLGEQPYACSALEAEAARAIDEQQTRNIVQALSQLNHPCAEGPLGSMLRSTDGATRMAAAQGLSRIKRHGAGAELLPLLQDPSMGVRREAAKALGATHAAAYARPLLEAARREGEPEARAAMLIAVGATQDARAAVALETFLSHSSETTRSAAAEGLCALGAKKGIEFARARLASADRFERLQGLSMLEASPPTKASLLLKPLLDDPDRTVAAAAAHALYRLGDASMLDWLVLHSFNAVGPEKEAYERELDTMRLSDDQRRFILVRAGLAKTGAP